MASALDGMRRERIALAIATSNSFDVKAILGEALLDRFAVVECGAALFGKAQRLRRILKKTQTDEAEAIYIGDEIRDAEAADRVGVSFDAVAWGYTDLEALLRTNPDRSFQAPAGLLNLSESKANRET